MAISSANVTSFVRSIIGESTAKYWTADEITLYVQFAMAKVQGELYPWLWEKNKNYTYIVTVAGTSEYDPPSDSYKLSYIQETDTGKEVRYIGEDEWYKYIDYDPGDSYVWTWKGGKIKIVPTPSASSPTAYIAWYMKNLDEIADFPDSCRALIGVEAAILARAKNEDVSSDLLFMQKSFRQAAITDLTLTNMNQPEFFGDMKQEDRLV